MRCRLFGVLWVKGGWRLIAVVVCGIVAVLVPDFFFSPVSGAQAASIRYVSSEVNIIAIEGEISPTDLATFERIVPDPAKKTAVVLSSPGGNVAAALGIGEAIHQAGYTTVVPDGRICASACGLIWLGGSVRMVSETARIGFHAAYVGEGPTAEESGVGNAMVGAYLAHIGLSYPAIAFLTSAAPSDMAWLHPDRAMAVGIRFLTLPARPSTEGWSAPPKPQPPSAAAVEVHAVAATLEWFRLWSQSGADVSYLMPYYPDTIRYYGGMAAKAKVVLEKQKFAARWPQRIYAVRQGSVSVQCASTCLVNGIVDWDVSSAERQERSVGSANFVLEMPPGGAVILGESGSVITSHKEKLGDNRMAAAQQ
jgi:hypothetical protein